MTWSLEPPEGLDRLITTGPPEATGPVTLRGTNCDANSVSAETDELAPPNHPEAGFSSLHAGGAFLLLGDGSVKFLSDDLDPKTYARLGAMADGAPVTGF